MAWRVILRIGLTSDTGSVLRNSLVETTLLSLGLTNTATGTWEAPAVTPTAAAVALTQILNGLAAPPRPPGVSLKHLWIYIDET